MSKKLGLALSGGGMRGIAHVGLLKWLQENDIKPQVIAGTSAGAIVAAMYVNETPIDEMVNFFKETELFNFKHLAWWKPGFLKTKAFAEDLKQYIKHDDIEDYDQELYINATELLSGEEAVFTSGSLVDAVLASSAYPGVFAPIEIDGKQYIDGGVLNNLPSSIIKEKCDLLLGMNVTPITEVTKDDIDNAFGLLKRVYELNTYKLVNEQEEICDICLSPTQLKQYTLFDSSKHDELLEIGYQAAEDSKEEIEKLMDG